MFRTTFRPYFAGLLLLCLGRTLLPEAWVLAWHSHQHTTEEATCAPHQAKKLRQLLLSSRHQHCHTEQFYDVPFTAAATVLVPLPRLRSCFPELTEAAECACQQPPNCYATPRGPPGCLGNSYFFSCVTV